MRFNRNNDQTLKKNMLKKILLGLLALTVLLAIGAYAYYRFVIYQPKAISEDDRKTLNLMPLPASLKLKKGTLDISSGLQLVYSGPPGEDIDNSTDRLFERLNKAFQKDFRNGKVVLSVTCLANAGEVQQVKEDESYSLEVDGKGIHLQANTSYGVLRGMETVFQLCKKEGDQILIPRLVIEDKPRFPWRGVMLDVSRHWMPKEVVLRIIDGMALAKMNVFHWHLSDDQGFRVESKVFTKLHEAGSNGKYYTQAEIREVIRYARQRGIRVVPEFDLPGHSKSWQIAYPELGFTAEAQQFAISNGVFTPPIDPTKESVYTFLDAFVAEMSALFPDPYMHIGGDEVNPKYWNENAAIRDFMQENALEDAHALQAYFNKRMYDILKKHGKQMLGWNEILHPDLGRDIIVQSWTSHRSLFEAVQQGGTAILSNGYYLDLILPAGKHYQVDPLVLEGAIDIVPDSTHWKRYGITIDIAGNPMNGELILFDRDPEHVFGFFSVMQDRQAFKNGTISKDQLNSSFEGPVGKMDFKATFEKDSMRGEISFGPLNFALKGNKTGGSDITGTALPAIEVIKPLSEEEKSRILGGEACQWAEFVDDQNVESRIWPRAAAIAEKLWSPAELTKDTEDMYRRLELFSNMLIVQGARHEQYYEEKLRRLAGKEGAGILKVLVEALEEVKYHGRMPAIMAIENLYLPDFALDRVVDAARPESLSARKFNQMTEQWQAEPKNEEVAAKIKVQLTAWQGNHATLVPLVEKHEKLKDIENISKVLSEVSAAALKKMENPKGPVTEELKQQLAFLETGEHGVIVAVVPGLRRILDGK